MQEQEIIDISSEILEIFLNIRKKKGKDFTIGFRQKDISKEEGKKRLVKGYWFLGSNYIFVPLFKKGDDARKVRTIGFVIGTNSKGQRTNYIEISCKGFNLSKQDLRFHQELSNEFNIKLNENNCGIYEFEDSEKYLTDNLSFYLNDFRSKAIELLDKYKLYDDYIITEEKFDKDLNKIIKIKEELGTVKSNTSINTVINTKPQAMNTPLNQILYGPPGTGKTYHTINKALAIVAPNFDLNQEREVVKQEFDKYVENGQIVFTTFHQSMTYEDFVEGIKPKVDEEQEEKSVYYEIEKGVFTKLVEHAKAHQIDKTEKKKIYTFEDGWNDLVNEATEAINNGSELVLPIQTPTMGLEVVDITDRGNLRLKPKSSDKALTYTVSITRTQKLYNVFNNLNTVKNIDKEFRAVIGGSNSTAYWAVLNYIINKVNGSVDTISEKQERKPYVLIIDEINRGNVSAIFGELITLIEVSKRLGKEEALQVILPYSKEKFGVPDNLYIIGTMNTADRSIEALDTALRRRFTFEEMIPKTEKVRSEIQLYNDLWKWKDVTWESKEWQIVEQGFGDLYGYTAEWELKKKDLWKEFVEKGYNESDAKDLMPLIENKLDLELILETINTRIEVLLDRDHLIGHSYFLGVDSIATLMARFKNNIIPLLQEYFYGDYGKIGLVLGKGFVTKTEGMKVSFASFGYDSEMYQDKITYTLKPIENEREFRKAIDALLIKK
ncbi:AAA family ATPase [Myroides marinus]|uniref:AAA family ATPase n=1 Tax=Myroides marinus TaxID=703342 RepID=UPI002578975C|nr:AAA family ATPase [Myroides marinus]